MQNPDQASAPAVNNSVNNAKEVRATDLSERGQLENDLKYVTGAQNRAELEEKLNAIKSREKVISDAANVENFKSGMSFNSEQKRVFNNFFNLFGKDTVKETLKYVGINLKDIDLNMLV